MQRKELQRIDGQRLRFTATLARRGERSGWGVRPVTTLLLTELARADTGQPLADHIWIDDGVWSSAIPAGAQIAFDARVGQYQKGYRGNRADIDAPPPSVDWHLARPTNVKMRNAEGDWTAAPRPAAAPKTPKTPAALASDRQLAYLAALRQAAGLPPPDGPIAKAAASAEIDALVNSLPKPQCAGATKSGARCSRRISPGFRYCGSHQPREDNDDAP